MLHKTDPVYKLFPYIRNVCQSNSISPTLYYDMLRHLIHKSDVLHGKDPLTHFYNSQCEWVEHLDEDYGEMESGYFYQIMQEIPIADYEKPTHPFLTFEKEELPDTDDTKYTEDNVVNMDCSNAEECTMQEKLQKAWTLGYQFGILMKSM